LSKRGIYSCLIWITSSRDNLKCLAFPPKQEKRSERNVAVRAAELVATGIRFVSSTDGRCTDGEEAGSWGSQAWVGRGIAEAGLKNMRILVEPIDVRRLKEKRKDRGCSQIKHISRARSKAT
jgi:hypothetical protein